MRDDSATDETLAAPGPLAQGTTRGNDPTVSAELVRQVTRASSPSLAPPVAPADHAELPVVDRANYQIIKELARGGMGRILEARDLRLGRPIAIKEVLGDDEGARARFDREIRITAGLQHPAIVHVTEAGQWPEGQPFFAMKLIRGKPLDVRIAKAMSLAERLVLLPAVIAVTDALGYAHTKSVIHRDLKPANVLVGDFGETVVIDWGIAKDLSEGDIVSLSPERSPAASGGAETVAGSVMGTPSYMPPEQANGDRVDARADVYALGAMLYQVLAGVPPFVGRTSAEVLVKVLEGSPVPLQQIVPDAPVDLIAIVEKAMAREPSERFPTAAEMVTELKRFQQGKLVQSHEYTSWQLVQRWLSRNRAAVLVGGVAFAALVVFGGLMLWRTVAARRAAEVEATAARTQADHGTISEARDALATDPTEALAILKRLHPGTAELRSARTLASQAAAAGIAHVLHADGAILLLAFSPDRRVLVSIDDTGAIRSWDLETWTSRTIGTAPDRLLDLVVTSGEVRAIDSGGRIWAWDRHGQSTQRLIRTIATTEPWSRARWSPDGLRVVLGGFDEAQQPQVRLVDLSTEDRSLGPYRVPEWTTDGRAILVYDRDKHTAIRLDAGTGESETLTENVEDPVLAGDATHTWIGRDSQHVGDIERTYVRELGSGRRLDIGTQLGRVLALPGGLVAGISVFEASISSQETMRTQTKGQFVPFDPDLVTRGDHAVLVSDGWPGSLLRLLGHRAAVTSFAAASDGTIASGDRSGEIRVWTLPVVARDHGDGHSTSTFAALRRGRELILTRRGPRLEVRDLVGGASRLLEITEVAPGIERDLGYRTERATRVGNRLIREVTDGPDDEVVEWAHSADQRRLVTLDSKQHAVVWDIAAGTGKLLADEVIHVAINSDGSKIATSRNATGKWDRVIEEWDVATGKATTLAHPHVLAMQYGPRDRLAVTTGDHTLALFDHGAQRFLATPLRSYRTLAFSPDGEQLFLGAENWEIAAYSVQDGFIRTLHGHLGTITALLVSPDGRQLYSASADHTVRVWNLEEGTSTSLVGHTGLVTSLELGDQDTLFTASHDGTARVWDLVTHTSRPLVGHEDRVLLAQQLEDNQRIVVVDRAHQVAEYADTLPRDELLLRAWLDSATNLTK